MKAFKIIMLSLFGMGIISINNEGYCSSNNSIRIQSENKFQQENNSQQENNHQLVPEEMHNIDNPVNPITINLPEVKNPSINELREIVKINKEGAGAGKIEDEFLKGELSFPGLDNRVVDTITQASQILVQQDKVNENSEEHKLAKALIAELEKTLESDKNIAAHPNKDAIIKEILCLMMYKHAKEIVDANTNEELNQQVNNIEISGSDLNKENKNEIVFEDNVSEGDD